MKIWFSLLFLLLSSWDIYAQLPKKKWFPQRSYQSTRPYWAAQGSLGIKKMNFTPTVFILDYNHPPDSLFPNQPRPIGASTTRGGSPIAINSTFALEAGMSKGAFAELRFDMLFKRPLIGSFEAGAGWNFELTYYENERLLTLRPVVDFVWLFNDINIGSYSFPEGVNSIAMVDAIFERRADLNFWLRNRAQGIKPRLSISTPLSEKWLLRADVGYLFVIKKRSSLRISQENINQVPYILAPDEPRLGFTMNGLRSRTDLFTYSGWFTQIGFARKFGDNRDNGRRYKNNRWK
jgi:hypothetical protein